MCFNLFTYTLVKSLMSFRGFNCDRLFDTADVAEIAFHCSSLLGFRNLFCLLRDEWRLLLVAFCNRDNNSNTQRQNQLRYLLIPQNCNNYQVYLPSYEDREGLPTWRGNWKGHTRNPLVQIYMQASLLNTCGHSSKHFTLIQKQHLCQSNHARLHEN